MNEAMEAESADFESILPLTVSLESAPVLPGSLAACTFLKIFTYKLSSQPKALKFYQRVCEHTWINPHNKDYDKKIGFHGPFQSKPLANET